MILPSIKFYKIKIIFEAPIKGYKVTTYEKLKEDISSLLNTSKDQKYKKILKSH